jgi:hypothetical protein
VKLIDFGVAKAAGRSSHTATGILKGKYAYMSPEQVDGLDIDHRSDIFALGVVFWEILAGKRLFKGDSDTVTMRLVRECNVPPPSEVNPAIPKALDAIVQLALAKDCARRYPDAAAFRMAIEDFIVAERVPASSAHLVAFLREVYARRIALEKTPANFDELSPTDILDEIRTPTVSEGKQVSKKPRVVAKSRGPGDLTLPLEETSGTRRIRRGGLVVIAAALLALGAALGLPRLLHAPATPSPQTGPVQPATHGAETPAPTSVALALMSDPEGARVQLDGRDIGSTPVNITATADAPPVTATFSLPGFEPTEAQISAKDAPIFSVQLQRKHPPNKTPNGRAPATNFER